MTRKIVIIGSGAAGMTAASEARKLDPRADITVFTEDEHIAYSPCAIPWVIEGLMEWKDIVMHDASFYSKERNITIRTKTKVTAIDGKNKTMTADGREHSYDSLVIATGGTVFVPPIDGKDLKNTFIVRTVNDSIAISEALPSVKKAVVVGAGVIGLEIAVALRNAGKDVTVVEMFDQVTPRIADRDIAGKVQKHLESIGIRFMFNTPVGAVQGKDGKVSAVVAKDETLECEMVIFATGVRANLEIPKMLELDIGVLGAVLTSPTMQPYSKGRLVNDVYIAGDVVQCTSAVTHGPTMSQLGSTAVKQGRIAGRNAAGAKDICGPTMSPWISMLDGMFVAGTGLSEGLAAWYGLEVITATADGYSNARYYPGGKRTTVKLLADASTGKLVGAQIVSGCDVNGQINWLSSVISSGTTVDEFLSDGENAYCPPTSMVRDVAFTAAESLSIKFKQA